ncbi:unnamed protein product [Durusdinium trenchii]|uniref:Uncharacterized protein n=1 Tax=Durusdinium trenchii TaxID=1381693 RepID=A0ABP0MHF5_9DINO
MTWGGLRGAVGLALVLSMRELLMQQGKQETARLMVFFVSGFAALTLLVNATTCSLLLKCLGLTKTPEAQSAILERLRHELFVVSRRAFTDSLDCDGRFKAVKEREINHMLEHLNAELDEPHEEWSMKLIGAGRWTLSGLTVSNNINPFAVRPAPEGAEPEKQEEKPEEKPEEKQDKGRTSALGAAPPRRSSIQAWDHHWWWGFEEIKVDREATWTRQTSQERQAGQAAPGSHQEREVFRKLFMSMLRAEYVRLMDVGMLPRRASGAEHLLASVDAADDWAAVRLNDWTILEKKLPRRASWIRVKVREMLSPCFVFCPVEINGGSHFFDLFTVVAFIDAHHTVCHGLLQSDWFSTDARSDVIEESLAELEAARKFLKENRVGERDISKVRTLQLASMLFQTQQDQVEKWKQQGIISAKEMEELLHLVKHGLDRSEMILKKQVLGDEEVSPKSSRKMTFSTLVRLLPGR